MGEKDERNARVQARYDELMHEGKHGHYETMFCVVREEVERERNTLAGAMKKFAPDLMGEFAARWEYSKLSPPEKLERLIVALREPPFIAEEGKKL